MWLGLCVVVRGDDASELRWLVNISINVKTHQNFYFYNNTCKKITILGCGGGGPTLNCLLLHVVFFSGACDYFRTWNKLEIYTIYYNTNNTILHNTIHYNTITNDYDGYNRRRRCRIIVTVCNCLWFTYWLHDASNYATPILGEFF